MLNYVKARTVQTKRIGCSGLEQCTVGKEEFMFFDDADAADVVGKVSDWLMAGKRVAIHHRPGAGFKLRSVPVIGEGL